MRTIRDYFRNGDLPKEGTVCEARNTMYEVRSSVDFDALGLSDEERLILGMSYGLADNYPIPKLVGLL